MTTHRIIAAALAAASLAGARAARADGSFVQSAGPRLGALYLTDKASREALNDRNAGKVLSLMGWQFEHEYFNTGTGVAGLVEVVPAIGGLETGLLLPSVTGLIGVRIFSFEAGMGPSFGVGAKRETGDDGSVRYVPKGGTGMALVVGKTARYGPVNFPINLVGIKNQDGYRVAFLLGWHMRQGSL